MNGIKVWCHNEFNSSWMDDESIEMVIFVGAVMPSEAEIRSNWEWENRNNGEDGSSRQTVDSIENIENVNEIIGSSAGTIIDIGARKAGTFNEGAIDWNAFVGGFDRVWESK